MTAMVLTNTADMSRDEWLKARKMGLGGSDAAAIMGMNPWKSPMMVYLEKRGELQDKEAGEAAKWGIALEPLIADEFKEQTKFHVQRRNAILTHPDYPWMIANVDRLIRDDKGEWGVLEIKTANQFKQGEWDGDKAPDQYVIQLQHYLAITGYSYGYLAVLIGGQRYKHIRVDRDEALIQALVEIEAEFWHRVVEVNPPAWSGLDCDQELLDAMYPKSIGGSAIELPPTTEAHIARYEEAKARKKLAEADEKAAAAELQASLGNNEAGWYGCKKVSWKTYDTDRFDTKRFKSEHPELVEQYIKTSQCRKFEVK